MSDMAQKKKKKKRPSIRIKGSEGCGVNHTLVTGSSACSSSSCFPHRIRNVNMHKRGDDDDAWRLEYRTATREQRAFLFSGRGRAPRRDYRERLTIAAVTAPSKVLNATVALTAPLV